MPHEVKSPPNAGTKGKPPLGIPKWGWIAAAAVGILLAYVVLRKSGTASASTDAGSGSSSTPLRNSDSNSGTGGGVVASPPPDLNQIISQLEALGLIGGTRGSSPAAVGGTGDSSTSTNPTAATSIDSVAPSDVLNPITDPSTSWIGTPWNDYVSYPIVDPTTLADPSVAPYAPIPDVPTHPENPDSPLLQNTPDLSNVHQPGLQI